MSVLVILAVAVGVGACSSSGSPASPSESESLNATALLDPQVDTGGPVVPSFSGAGSAIPSPSPASTSVTINFTYTDADGWHYTGSIPVPSVTLALSKDISASPPGQAQAKIELSGDVPTGYSFQDDNPGRPGGPELDVGPGGFVYKFTGALQAFEGNGSAQQLGPCFTSSSTDASWQPYEYELDCSFGTDVSSGTSDPVTESAVDALVAINTSAPIYGFSIAEPNVNLSTGVNSCNIYVSTVSGAIVKRDDTQEFSNCDGHLSMTISRS